MNQETINQYVDNLDVNTQADLLKQVLYLLDNAHNDYEQYNGGDERGSARNEFEFIINQINEFDEQYKKQKEVK